MNEHDREAFVRALLAREDRVGEEQYTEHRRQLDRRLDEAARRGRLPWLPRGRRAGWAAAVIAACVLGLLPWRGWRPAVEREPSGERRLIVLAPPAERAVAPAPYELELTADLIATAALGEPFRHGGDEVSPLRLERVLKGAPPAGKSLFCCPSGGPEPVVPRDGGRVLAYLKRSGEADWRLMAVRLIDEHFEVRDLPAIQRWLAVAGAATSADPAAEYRRLLAPEAGGLDLAACSFLTSRPDPRSAGALLEQLDGLRRRILRASAPAPTAPPIDEFVTLAVRLAELLAPLREPRAASPLAECASHLPRGRRAGVYQHLPALCRSADGPARGRVRDALVAEVEDAAGHPADFAAAAHALGRVADERAVGVLARRQAREPIAEANAQAARALEQAAAALGPAGPGRVREAWVALLCSLPPRATPTAAEQGLVREVVRLLRTEGLSPDQQRRLREACDRPGAAWIRDELGPVTK